MSSETLILDRLRTDLGNITIANQYVNSSKKLYEGQLDLSKMTDFDVICYYPGNRKPGTRTNNGIPVTWSLDIWVHVMFKAEKGESKLVRKGESWINDFRKWFYRDSTITENKWFTLDQESRGTPAVAGLDVVQWNSRSLDDIQRFAIWEKDVGEIVFKININYSLN